MFNLPDDNPFSPIVRLIYWLCLINTVCMGYLVYAGYKFLKRVNRSEERQIRLLTLSEGYSELAANRKEEVRIEIARAVEEVKKELKERS